MKPGDLVKLKSGGPSMTIVSAVRAGDLREPGGFALAWFKDGEMHTAAMPEAALDLLIDDRAPGRSMNTPPGPPDPPPPPPGHRVG